MERTLFFCSFQDLWVAPRIHPLGCGNVKGSLDCKATVSPLYPDLFQTGHEVRSIGLVLGRDKR